MKPNLLPNDYSRCSNDNCEIRLTCKRFLQLGIDCENKVDKIASVANFESKNCEKIIKI